MAAIERFANPNRFLRFARPCLPWLAAIGLASLGAGLYLGLVASPPDYQQGDSVRIMYVHVPAAWMALFCYVSMAGAAGTALVLKHPLADLAARATAPIGAAFTLLALATGSLWGKPMWGTWWVWDARLTSVFVLLLMYLGLMALHRAMDDPAKGARAAAIVALVGFINIPIIKFSVDWWNTLHQPASVAKLGGPSIHPSILVPLLVMAAAFICLFFVLHLTAMKTEVLRRRVHALRLQQVDAAMGNSQ